MPEITRFYGIIIKIFFADHPPPHFHAIYGEYNALFNLETLEIIEGDLPNRATKMVVEWAYNCENLLEKTMFSSLKNYAFFKNFQLDPSGSGIVWNDEVDISEYEIWINGIEL